MREAALQQLWMLPMIQVKLEMFWLSGMEREELYHAVMITDVVTDEGWERNWLSCLLLIQPIQKDYQSSAYGYTYQVLIKILGGIN